MNNFSAKLWQKITFASLVLSALTACNYETKQSTFTGYVEAELVYLAAPQSGWINTMNWHAGKYINTSDLAFELDNTQQLNMINEAQAHLDQAIALELNGITGAREQEIAVLTAQYKQAQIAVDYAASEQARWNNLVKQGLAPESKSTQVNTDYQTSVAKLESIKASIDVAKLGVRAQLSNSAKASKQAAQASLEQAKWQLSQRRVVSQVSGTVEEIFYRQGEFINAGKPVMAILPDNALIIRFFVPQALLTNFTVGKSVHVHADGIADSIDAKIFNIARSAEFTPPVIYDQTSRQKLMFLVQARLPNINENNAQLRPGLPVEVTR